MKKNLFILIISLFSYHCAHADSTWFTSIANETSSFIQIINTQYRDQHLVVAPNTTVTFAAKRIDVPWAPTVFIKREAALNSAQQRGRVIELRRSDVNTGPFHLVALITQGPVTGSHIFLGIQIPADTLDAIRRKYFGPYRMGEPLHQRERDWMPVKGYAGTEHGPRKLIIKKDFLIVVEK